MGVVVLWTGKVSLVILSLILPVLAVPLIGLLLFPEVPLTTTVLAGFFVSLFVAIGLRLVQSAKALGARFAIVLVVLCVLVGLLTGLLSKLLF
ncbi:MAG: hypothetical protein ACQCN4_07890 [Candidatus Bathyarchaeia archaeon]